MRHNDSEVLHFFVSIMEAHFPKTDNRTFLIRIMKAGQCSYDCYCGVIISTLNKYLLDRLYHYTNYNLFLDYSK